MRGSSIPVAIRAATFAHFCLCGSREGGSLVPPAKSQRREVPACAGTRHSSTEKLLFELLGHFLDVLRRPAGDVHAEAQAHAGQHFP